jgi:hypothetical protein
MIFGGMQLFSSESSSAGAAGALNALSRDVDAANSSGLRNMAWKPASDTAIAPSVIDVQWLVQQPDLPFLVQALPAQLLHRSLVSHGLDDSLEVIEWIRGRQLVRFMDYEIWERNPEVDAEDVSSSVLVQWFRRWLEIGPQFAAERVSDFEEETLVLMFTKLLDIQVEGHTRFDVEAHDDYWTTIDGRFHLRVKDDDPASYEVVKQVLDALYGLDIKWAGSILSHASMLLRSESLDNALRWREGRMADAGFVPAEEARSVLRPRRMSSVQADIAKAVALETARRSYRERVSVQDYADDESASFDLDSELAAELSDSVRDLLRSLDPEMAVRAIELSLGSQGVSKLTDGAHLAPEHFVDDEEVMEEAISGIVKRTQSLLLRLDVSSQRGFRDHHLLIERVFALISEENPAECAALKSRLARVSNMVLSATANAVDPDAQGRALTVVRGCLNLALELMLSRPQDFGLAQISVPVSDAASVFAGVEVLKIVGPEYLFQVGWSALSDLSVSAASAFEDVLPEQVVRAKSKLFVLAQEQRYAEIRRWLASVESQISAPVFHVISSLVNRIPLYPEVLSVQGNALSATALRRAFESQADLERAREFVNSLARMDIVG